MEGKKQKRLEHLFFHESNGIGGQERFYQAVKKEFSREEVSLFYKTHPVVNKYFGIRHKRKNEVHSMNSNYPMERIHIDLFHPLQGQKGQKQYPLGVLAVDSYSRYLFVEPLRGKAADYIIPAMEKIIVQAKEMLPTPQAHITFISDMGMEWMGKNFTALMRRHACYHYQISHHNKAFLSEGYIRRFKERLTLLRDFDSSNHNKKHWIKYCQKIVDLHNSSKVASLHGFTPEDAVKNTKPFVDMYLKYHKPASLKELYSGMIKSVKGSDIKVGTRVRLKLNRWSKVFDKPSTQPFLGEEVFLITTVKPGLGRQPYYRLTDLSGTPIKCKYVSVCE